MDTKEKINDFDSKEEVTSLGGDSSFDNSYNSSSYGGWTGVNNSYDGEEVTQSNILSQLSPASDIKTFAHYLRGETFVPERGVYKKTFEPILNEKGQNYLIGIFSGIATQTLRTTYLKKGEADAIVEYALNEIIPTMQVEHELFGVENPTLLPPIYAVIAIHLRALVNKAIGGGERTFIKGTYGERGLFSQREGYGGQEEKGGFFSKLFRR